MKNKQETNVKNECFQPQRCNIRFPLVLSCHVTKFRFSKNIKRLKNFVNRSFLSFERLFLSNEHYLWNDTVTGEPGLYVFFRFGKVLMRVVTSHFYHTQFASRWLYFSDLEPIVLASHSCSSTLLCLSIAVIIR